MFPPKQPFLHGKQPGAKILTLDKLQRRGWHLSNSCYLCGRNEESTHHILLHCPVVSHLWALFLSLVGLSWVFPKTVKETLLSWKGSFIGKKRKNMWKYVPPCIFWTVWKERNHITFRDGIIDVQKLKHSFVYNLWSWNRLYIGEEISSLIGFLEWVATS